MAGGCGKFAEKDAARISKRKYSGMDFTRPCLLLYLWQMENVACTVTYGDGSSARIGTVKESSFGGCVMDVLKNLQSVVRAVRPPCARFPYRLGLVKFVQIPCPACRMDSYRTFDVLTRGQRGFPESWRGIAMEGKANPYRKESLQQMHYMGKIYGNHGTAKAQMWAR